MKTAAHLPVTLHEYRLPTGSYRIDIYVDTVDGRRLKVYTGSSMWEARDKVEAAGYVVPEWN